MLLLLNGAPGVGKSALADRYAADHALALVIDIDEIRRHLGQWEQVDASKQAARDLAVELARAHLRSENHVVVPQYVGRREFVERLETLAGEAGTRFVEVIVTDDDDRIAQRFRDRRATFSSGGVRHPEADLTDDAVVEEIHRANEALRARALAHGVPVIAAGDGIDVAYRSLCDVLQVD